MSAKINENNINFFFFSRISPSSVLHSDDLVLRHVPRHEPPLLV